MTKGVSEKPKGSTGELSGRSQPQLLACRTPMTTVAIPRAARTEPTQSSRGGLASLLGLAQVPGPEEDQRRDHHLADEDDAPCELGGRPPAENRPNRDPRSGDAPEHSIRDRPLRSSVVARHERDERRQHHRRPDPLEDRPTQHQRRDTPRGRRERRSRCVDHEPDREDSSAAPDVAELGAGDHQRCHHERIQRDHRLDRCHRRVEVRDQLRDRDVHHGLVEDHQELGGREDDEDRPLHPRSPDDDRPRVSSLAIPTL